jgi:hypothetical protein
MKFSRQTRNFVLTLSQPVMGPRLFFFLTAYQAVTKKKLVKLTYGFNEILFLKLALLGERTCIMSVVIQKQE